jgi:hypothetical protein
MAFNPDQKVADARDIATKWNKVQVIIIGIDHNGNMTMATYGKTPDLCSFAKQLGDAAWEAIMSFVERIGKV